MLDPNEELERVQAYAALNQPLYNAMRAIALNPTEADVPFLSAFALGVLSGLGMAYQSVVDDTPIDLDSVLLPDSPEGLV